MRTWRRTTSLILLGILASLAVAHEHALALPRRRRGTEAPESATRQVVIPVIVEGENADFDSLAFADELEDTMRETGAPLFPGMLAAILFEDVHSAEPESSTEVIEQWTTAVDQARRLMATRRLGRFRAALAALHDVRRSTDLAIAALGREEAGTGSFLDACFIEAAVHLEQQRQAAARDVLMACRRMMAHVEPSGTSATPDVRDIVAAIDRELAASPHSTLRIESEPGCLVRLTGVALGQTPITIAVLPQDAVPVQVECGTRPGRVHRINLRRNATLRVDTVREAAIRSRPPNGPPRMYLSYPTRAEAQRDSERDAALIEEVLGTSVILVMPHDDARVRLVRVSRTMAPARYVAVRDRSDQLMFQCAMEMSVRRTATVDRVALGVGSDELAPPPIPEPMRERDREQARERSPWNYTLALGLIGGGAVPLGIGLRAHARAGHCVSPDSEGRCIIDPTTGAWDEYVFDVRGRVLVGTGAVIVGAGIYVLVAGPIGRRTVVPSVAPIAGGLTLSVRGEF